MAYLIGNTTVITNNAALGSVDGNSLNLANNNNISAGGASYFSTQTTATGVSVVGSSLGIIYLTAGGGGGGPGVNQNSAGGGGGSMTVIQPFEIDPAAPTYDITIGAGGAGGNLFGNGGSGGTSTFAYPNIDMGSEPSQPQSGAPTAGTVQAIGGAGGNSSPQGRQSIGNGGTGRRIKYYIGVSGGDGTPGSSPSNNYNGYGGGSYFGTSFGGGNQSVSANIPIGNAAGVGGRGDYRTQAMDGNPGRLIQIGF
jgi:hypothetical protein